MKHFKIDRKNIRILGIETSCDETAASIVQGDGGNPPLVLSNIVASQIKIHAKTGGIIPEVAARAHIEKIIPVIKQSLATSYSSLTTHIDAIAVTVGPGLAGSLLVGAETAKTLSYVFDKPIIPINHLEGHIYSNFVQENQKSSASASWRMADKNQKFPIMCLIVSGGHTSLVLMKDYGKYQEIGSTRDDAAGEAFDKVAAMLGLSYPGGPSISKAADQASKLKVESAKLKTTTKNLKLPRPMIHSDDFDFSFSGLKTAVLYLLKNFQKLEIENWKLKIAAIAAEFQQAVVDVLVSKTIKAARQYNVKSVALCGGVSANQLLRKTIANSTKQYLPHVTCRLSPLALSTDNAAMIATAGYYRYIRKDFNNWKNIKIDTNLSL